VDLGLSSSSVDGRTVVHVGGEVDVYTAPALRRYLDEQIHRGCRDLVIDLSGVTFLDSTGLGVLVGRLKAMRMQGGVLRLAGPTERVVKVFSITGLDRVFDIVASFHDLDVTPDNNHASPDNDASRDNDATSG
jgi:anti-sigma B factor antagonist